jgi:2-phosphoglycerate kinase
MVLLIGGASHTGKTVLAQRILEERHVPYLSIDHLKMGLIRSGQTELTPMDDEKLTPYLWPIVREMVKTAIENGQNLTVEGCYIPFDWKKDFSDTYLQDIRCVFLVMSEDYIRSHFGDIRHYANAIEQRLDDSGLSMEDLMRSNAEILAGCKKHDCEYVLIDEKYDIAL